jgi:hypothetical protein
MNALLYYSKMTQYNTQYTRIKQNTISAVRHAIIEQRIFKAQEEQRYNILRELNAKLCEIYNLIPCEIVTAINTDGFYNPLARVIALNKKLSLITFLHEFKHFLQHERHAHNSEEIARAWSISLFYLASEKHFNRALRKGLIIHQKE